METVKSRPWYRLHWLTWLAIAIEVAAIAYLQSVEQRGGSYYLDRSDWYNNHVIFGWPAWDLWRYEVIPLGNLSQFMGFKYVLKVKPLIFNCFVWALLTFSVGWLAETRLRRPNRLQFSVRGLAVFFAVVAVMLTLVKQGAVVEGGMILMGLAPAKPFQPWFGAPLELNACAWATIVVIFLRRELLPLVSRSSRITRHLSPTETLEFAQYLTVPNEGPFGHWRRKKGTRVVSDLSRVAFLRSVAQPNG